MFARLWENQLHCVWNERHLEISSTNTQPPQALCPCLSSASSLAFVGDHIGANLLFHLAVGTVDPFPLSGCCNLLLRDADTNRHITMRRPDNSSGEPATPNRTSSGL